MKCRLDEDDRCITHRTPAEQMDHCPHDGLTCDHSQCREPDCHTVKSRKVPGPLTKLLPVCVLCGPVASATDADGVKEARANHHQEVMK